MKKNTSSFSAVLLAVAALLASPAFADLGLSQLAATQGAPAVGQAVLTAAQAVYANQTDPAVIGPQLISILNEAAATGNEQAVRYALVAVMMAGGSDHLAQSIDAINNSNAFSQYKSLTATTVASVASLMGGGAGSGAAGGGDDTLGGGTELGGGDNNSFLLELGLDPNNPFTWGSLTGPGAVDLQATPI
jgi:hypothetical protein